MGLKLSALGQAGKAGTGGSAGSVSSGGKGGTAGAPATGGTGGSAGSVASGGAGGSAGTTPMGGTTGEAGTGGGSGAGGRSRCNGRRGWWRHGGHRWGEYLEAATTDPDAVEIINKSGADMNLAGCSVLVHENGSVAATGTIALSGTVDDGDVFVLCTAAIGARCDQTSAVLDLDKNDAVVLRCGTTVLDVIGRTIGASPGSQWGNATVGTLNQTLRRNCEVTIGDRNGDNPFTPSAQWSSFAVGTVTGLGSATCG